MTAISAAVTTATSAAAAATAAAATAVALTIAALVKSMLFCVAFMLLPMVIPQEQTIIIRVVRAVAVLALMKDHLRQEILTKAPKTRDAKVFGGALSHVSVESGLHHHHLPKFNLTWKTYHQRDIIQMVDTQCTVISPLEDTWTEQIPLHHGH